MPRTSRRLFTRLLAPRAALATALGLGLFLPATAASAVNGDMDPTNVIGGSNTHLASVYSVYATPDGTTYVTGATAADVIMIDVFAPGATGNATPIRTIAGSKTNLSNPYGIAVDSAGYLYEADANRGSVLVFAPNANGNVAPVRTIHGAATGMSSAEGLAVDSARHVWVTNVGSAGDAVLEFAAGANGNVAPIAKISGPDSGLGTPNGIALGSDGYAYVVNTSLSDVTVYPVGASGDVPPVRTIGGADTQLNGPYDDAIAPDGSLAVASYDGKTIELFSPGADGDATPTQVLEGAQTQFQGPWPITYDSRGDLLVGDYITGYVLEFASSSISPAPARVLLGSNTQVDSRIGGLAVDKSGNIYASVQDTDSIQVFGPTVNGDTRPARTIAGPDTDLGDPQGLAVDSAGYLYVADLTTAAVLVFAPGANGNAAPVREITSAGQIVGVAVDSNGRIWTANNYDNTLQVFAAGANGDATPIQTIAGPDTGVIDPTEITVDSSGTAYVANSSGESVTSYPFDANGDALPQTTISGPDTDMYYPLGIAVAKDGSLAVTGYDLDGNAAVFTWGSDETGDVTPSVVQSDGDTNITYPWMVAIDPGGNEWIGNVDTGSIVEYGTAITSVETQSGSTAGGTSVVIRGKGFAKGATVAFGGTAATKVTVISATEITAVTPKHPSGLVTVSVTSGGKTGVDSGGFTYVALGNPSPIPAVSPQLIARYHCTAPVTRASCIATALRSSSHLAAR